MNILRRFMIAYDDRRSEYEEALERGDSEHADNCASDCIALELSAPLILQPDSFAEFWRYRNDRIERSITQ